MTTAKDDLIEARRRISDAFGAHGEFKLLHEDDGDFGSLDGLQFDCERCGGFLYIWSRGRVEFHLVDYQQGREVLPLTANDGHSVVQISEIVDSLIAAIGNLKGF